MRERVYDTVTGDHLLIPQGAKLFGWYDSKVAWGQERVLLCWDRVIFPNGSSINLECMPAADLQGQAGLADEVDNHWDRLAAAVGLSTILSVGTQALAGDPSGYQPNLAQRAAANAAGQINSAGQAFVQRQLNLQPTVTIRPGFPVNLIATKEHHPRTLRGTAVTLPGTWPGSAASGSDRPVTHAILSCRLEKGPHSHEIAASP